MKQHRNENEKNERSNASEQLREYDGKRTDGVSGKMIAEVQDQEVHGQGEVAPQDDDAMELSDESELGEILLGGRIYEDGLPEPTNEGELQELLITPSGSLAGSNEQNTDVFGCSTDESFENSGEYNTDVSVDTSSQNILQSEEETSQSEEETLESEDTYWKNRKISDIWHRNRKITPHQSWFDA